MAEQPTILVVDDLPGNIKLLDAVLAPHGYRIVTAGSGTEALLRVHAEPPDLVLLDLLMPGLDGHGVCRKLREDPATRGLPVIMITASSDADKVRALESGADDFIVKPLNGAELLARVRSLLRIKQYHDTIEAQARELAGWNRTLEQRVREQVQALEAAQVQLIEKERLERELQVAYEIQVSILPRVLPVLRGYDFGARMAPARVVGGDLFDLVRLDADHIGIAVGDVTDKGVPAAIFMAQTHALLRAEAGRSLSPEEVLWRTNRHLAEMNAAGLFVTMLYGVLERSSGSFSYARAGHELPIVVRENRAATVAVMGKTLPLGIELDPPLDQNTITLTPGSTLLLYSDGITDARDPQGTSFGLERLQTAVCEATGTSAQALCDRLLQIVTRFQDIAPQHDDVTLVAVRAPVSAE